MNSNREIYIFFDELDFNSIQFLCLCILRAIWKWCISANKQRFGFLLIVFICIQFDFKLYLFIENWNVYFRFPFTAFSAHINFVQKDKQNETKRNKMKERNTWEMANQDQIDSWFVVNLCLNKVHKFNFHPILTFSMACCARFNSFFFFSLSLFHAQKLHLLKTVSPLCMFCICSMMFINRLSFTF